jgi:hypothetical protein
MSGLDQLINVCKKVLRGGKESISVLMDMSVVTMKETSNEMEVSLTISIGESTLIKKHDEHKQIFWLFTKEELEDAVGRLEQCKAEGYFSPAEFIRVKVPKNRRLDYIYCEMKMD